MAYYDAYFHTSASPAGRSCGTVVANPGQVTIVSGSGRKISSTITATPNTDCGWRFIKWEVEISTSAGVIVRQTINDSTHTFSFYETTYGGSAVVFYCTAYFEFAGTGLIMSSSASPGALIWAVNGAHSGLLIDS